MTNSADAGVRARRRRRIRKRIRKKKRNRSARPPITPPTIENFACLSIPSGCGDEDGDGGSVANTGTEGETVSVVDDCGSEVVTTK